MLSFDFVVASVACTQPLIIGLLAFIGFGRVTAWTTVYQSLTGLRSSITNFRVYECATATRLNNLVSFNFAFFSVIVTFLIYDVDLVFFASELILISGSGPLELIVLTLLLFLLVFGLVLELRVNNFNWRLS